MSVQLKLHNSAPCAERVFQKKEWLFSISSGSCKDFNIITEWIMT